MSGNPVLSHNQIVDEIADKYEKQGYRVIIEPKQLPDFLKGYRPDLLAEGQSESVVVEVKVGREVRRADYWSSLAATVGQQPGWRFELVVANPQQSPEKESISIEEIEALLRESEQLEQRGNQKAALLVTWPALEASLRFAAETHRVDTPDDQPQTLIGRLYSDGVLEEEEYRALKQGLRIRNATVHGFRGESVQEELLHQLRALARHLVSENGADE